MPPLMYAVGAAALLLVPQAGGGLAADVAARPCRIALVSDTHTTRGTAEDQPLYKGRLDAVIAEVNAAKVDLVLIAGDLTQSGKPQEMADFQAQINKFSAPVRFVPGNHDVGNKRIPGKEGGVTAERVAGYEVRLGPSFWADAPAGVRIVGINASLLGSELPREADQWAFLESELAKPAALPTLLVMHNPPFLKTADEPGGDYWNIEPGPRARLLALVKQGGVKAVLTGHLHYPLVNLREGVLFVTTPPVSFGLPRGKQPQGWTLVTLSAEGEIQARTRYITDSAPPATKKR